MTRLFFYPNYPKEPKGVEIEAEGARLRAETKLYSMWSFRSVR